MALHFLISALIENSAISTKPSEFLSFFCRDGKHFRYLLFCHLFEKYLPAARYTYFSQFAFMNLNYSSIVLVNKIYYYVTKSVGILLYLDSYFYFHISKNHGTSNVLGLRFFMKFINIDSNYFFTNIWWATYLLHLGKPI